jgi:hypothetical protein
VNTFQWYDVLHVKKSKRVYITKISSSIHLNIVSIIKIILKYKEVAIEKTSQICSAPINIKQSKNVSICSKSSRVLCPLEHTRKLCVPFKKELILLYIQGEIATVNINTDKV